MTHLPYLAQEATSILIAVALAACMAGWAGASGELLVAVARACGGTKEQEVGGVAGDGEVTVQVQSCARCMCVCVQSRGVCSPSARRS